MTWAGVQIRHDNPPFWSYEEAARAAGFKRAPEPVEPETEPEAAE